MIQKTIAIAQSTGEKIKGTPAFDGKALLDKTGNGGPGRLH